MREIQCKGYCFIFLKNFGQRTFFRCLKESKAELFSKVFFRQEKTLVVHRIEPRTYSDRYQQDSHGWALGPDYLLVGGHALKKKRGGGEEG